jgi:hypothetical protein
MSKDDTIILCDPAVLGGKSELKQRTLKGGGVRYGIRVESEPLIHSFDPKVLGEPVAAAMAEALRAKVRGITAVVSASTLAFRRKAARSYAQGARWAMKRYSGGRMGGRAPNTSARAFNDSGRFAESIAVGPGNDDAWHINVAANRLDERSAGGELGIRRMWNRLVQLVPEFGEPMRLFNDRTVQEGLKTSLEAMIVKAEMTRDRLTEAKARAKLALVRQVLGLLAG